MRSRLLRSRLPLLLLVVLAVLLSLPGPTRAGETELSPGVKVMDPTNTGAASTAVPIEVVPGRGGIAPQLALSYSSSKGNDWIGVGWDLSMGEIQRSTKYGVNYSVNDYIFNGGGGSSELVSIGGNEYRAKLEGSFSKVYYNASTGGWEVTNKDGSKHYYGTTSASRQDSAQGVFKWLLDKVVDPNGNYMTVSYWKDQGEIYLYRIDYTGNTAGLSPTNYVQFTYEGRSDAGVMYTSNAAVTTAYRLKTIEVYGNGQIARKYELTYTYSAGTARSLLSSVTPYGYDINTGQLVQAPIIQFGWQAGSGFSGPVQWGSNGHGEIERYKLGDFDGDGRTDVIAFESNGGFYVWRSNGNGFNPFTQWGANGADLALQGRYHLGDFNGDGRTDIVSFESNGGFYVWLSTGSGFAYGGQWGANGADLAPQGRYQLGDFNGDGKTDIISFESNGGFYVWQSTGSGFSGPVQWGSNGHGDVERYKLGDFDGDGRTDVVAFESNGGFYVWRSNGNGFNPFTQWGSNGGDVWQQYKLGDFNGDGKTDIIQIDNGGSYVWLSTGNSFTQWAQWGSGHTTIDQLGDLNGDGRTDVLQFYNGNLVLARSAGNGLSSWTQWGSGASSELSLKVSGRVYQNGFYDLWGSGNKLYTTYYLGNTSLGDNSYLEFNAINNQISVTGRMWEFARWDTQANGSSTVNWVCGGCETSYLGATTFQLNDVQVTATGSALRPGALHVAGSSNRLDFYNIYYVGSIFFNLNHNLQVGDFNGDGRSDVIQLTNGAFSVWTAGGQTPDLLSTVNNGIGGITTISYAPSTVYSNSYMPFMVQTVSSISVDDGKGHVSTSTFTYSGGLYDRENKEFKGFQYEKTTAPTGAYTETRYHQDAIYGGLPYEQVVWGSDGYVYSKTNNYYTHATPYSGGAFPYLYQKDDYLCDGATSNKDNTSACKHTKATFAYDTSTGNLTRKSTYGDLVTPKDDRHEYIEYDSTLAAQWIFRPSRSYVTDSTGAIKAQSWMTYDTWGNVKSKESWLDTGGGNPRATFEYDAYGNQIAATDPKGNRSTVEYDSTYTYPVRAANALGHVSKVTYDLRTGKVTSKEDPNGNIVTFDYDPFGRLIETTTPENSAGGFVWKESHYDGLGRVIKTRKGGPDGKVIVTETLYNNYGQAEYASLPYFTDALGNPLETKRWSRFYYDPIGRVSRVDHPDTTYETKSYWQGRTTSIDSNGHVKVEEKDLLGRLVKVEEYTGVYPNQTLYATTTYEYDILGNLLKVTDAAGNQTAMAYDSLGRKVSMDDPDMGHWEYRYDSVGNLITQVDAKGQTITFSYDPLGRVLRKHYPTGPDVVYTYDETFSTNSKGRLTTVTDTSGMEKFYYDNLGRTVKTVKTVDGVAYTTETAYDSLGRTASIKYPDGEVINYTYDGGGNLQSVQGYVTYSNYNALGQAGTLTYANGVVTTQQYRPDNNRLYSITTNSPTAGLQNMSYEYDNVGNVKTITDLIDGNRTQTFLYDDLNRLTKATSTGTYGVIDWTYNQIGNMTYNSKLGAYTYNTNGVRPHAVIQAGANSYAYDDNGNMVNRKGRVITYDYDNRPSSIVYNGGTASFVYDFAGDRVKKITASGTDIYIGKLYRCNNGDCTKYIFGGGTRIAAKNPTRGTHYYHGDHLGSASVVTDSAGNKVQDIYYYPYGETRYKNGSVDVRHKYTGQEEDPETGLYYYNARYYDPELGRFISADTIIGNPRDPQDLNRYSYAGNNPLRYTDPTGHLKLGKIFKAVVRGIVKGVSYAVGLAISGGNPVVATMVSSAVDGAIYGGKGGVFKGIVGGLKGMIVPPIVSEIQYYRKGKFLDNFVYAQASGFGFQVGAYAGDAVISGISSAGGEVGGPHGNKVGVNIDPNGTEFENPTGGEIRGCDKQGCGYWGASRDNGRKHWGVDYVSEPGQEVIASFSGMAYEQKSVDYPGVIIAGEDYTSKALYVTPSAEIAKAGYKGVWVMEGEVIGRANDIRGRYPGITNHVHFELYGNRALEIPINPTPYITGRW